MRAHKKIIASMVLAGTLAFAGILAATGCANNSSSSSDEATSSQAAVGQMKSLDEYAEEYPLQTESWLRLQDDGSKSMGSMHDNFVATLGAAFGINGVPLYCGSCHNANYEALLAERGDENMAMTDTDAGIEVEYMGCGVCHTSDLNAGVSDNTSFWKGFISEESWEKNINQDDAVCGQCHMLEPSSAYMLPEYRGTVDIYKYGVEDDDVMKAMLEAWDENPIELTQLMIDNAFQVGATRIDEETGALIIGDNNKPILETFQDSNHQKMGLTCTDCHMVSSEAEDGTTYTDHFACDPLSNETALEFCLTCHESQGQKTTDEMREFVEGKQADLAAAQQAFEADKNTLHDLLADAVANGGVDEDVLKAAQDAYTKGVFYYQFQAQLTSDKANQGVTAAHNPEKTYATIEKGEKIVKEAIESLS